MLKKLTDINPNSQWWIKGDGTDVIKGLWESVSGVWSGNIDLNDGKLDQLYKEFEKKLNGLKVLECNTRLLNKSKTSYYKLKKQSLKIWNF